MPVYNGEAFLSEAIESVLRQTHTAWELLAIDDGSADNSPTILERYAAVDSRVRLMRNETNLGVAATLNRGWREACGEYIARLDADDVALPDRFVRQVKFLDAHESVAVVGTNAILIDAEHRRLSATRLPTASAAIRSTLRRHNCLNHPSVMVRRTVLAQVGGYRFDGVEDYDLWLRMSERYDLANLAEPMILYRIHPNQVSLRGLEEKVRQVEAVRTAAHVRRRSHTDPLAGVEDLTPEILERVDVDEAKLASALELEWITCATVLADLGRAEEAADLVAQASRRIGPRAARAFAAAAELRKAEKLRSDGRTLSCATHVLRALRCDPRYASSRLAGWLADRFISRLPFGMA